MKRIMVVEDSQETLEIIVELLNRFEYSVVATSMDGEAAITDYFNTRPDLLLLDLALPKKNGFEVIKEILSEFPDAKIIVISALYNSKHKKRAMDAGCLDYILKPFEIFDLITPIDRALST